MRTASTATVTRTILLNHEAECKHRSNTECLSSEYLALRKERDSLRASRRRLRRALRGVAEMFDIKGRECELGRYLDKALRSDAAAFKRRGE